MRLLQSFIAMAQKAGLQSALPVDPVAPTFSVPAGDYGYVISGLPGDPPDADARVSLGFGLSHAREPGDIASLVMRYDAGMQLWMLEYELKGDDPPPEIRALAERFGLVDHSSSVGLVADGEPDQVAKAMMEFIIAERQRLQHEPIRSTIPVGEFLASGQRLP